MAAREAWFDAQPDLDPERLVFIDETGATTKMARTRGRGPRGERLRAGAPHGHWKTTTFVGGLRLGGMTAPMVLDGPMTSAWFLAYVEQILVPTLRHGDVVILDNLPAHKGAAVRHAVEAVGARLLFLPPYSPDFNPIENASPSSRRSCAKPPHAPSTSSGKPSPPPSTPSLQATASATSPRQATSRIKRKVL